ncbi:SEC-C metal-binding domain-containing protein [Sphingobacterium sp.]|uniref:SEC-C metal-binding domain-containing protein n=1 Tax=Sphingobacterium sp. TaxID=341027 RepID=UPI00289F3002|nr:SEC-C metal-binding domain-containing protein [Sphingobacterium sp.]
MNNPSLKFAEEAINVINKFPELKLLSRENSLPYLEGQIDLFDQNGRAYDSYFVKIECSEDYPHSFPLVYEINERLPNNIDWHVYPNGQFCICAPPEEYFECSRGISLLSFIEKHLIPYLHNQAFRELNGYYLNERSHGKEGVLESLYNILGTTNANKVLEILMYIYKNKTPSRTSKCFCASGKKYRQCHRNAFIQFKKIGLERLKLIIKTII